MPAPRPLRTRQRAARGRLLEQITACWSTQALQAAIDLDLPDRLAEGASSVEALAEACGAQPEALERLLRALCTLDVCREGPDGRFRLAAAGGALRRGSGDDGSPSLRALVQWWSGPMWALWPELGYSVRTGRSARERATGQTGYGFLDAQPDKAAVFHEAMQALTGMIVDDIAALELWRDVEHVVDVGGGHGTLAAAIAVAHPHLRASVLDRADAMPSACAQFAARGLASRCRFVIGDFFAEVPAGADAYLLKSILHNWDDVACARILATCARAAAPGDRILLVERVRPARLRPRRHDAALARTDLNMLAGLGGRERTEAEFSALLHAAGFEILAVRSTGFEFSVMEARRR